MAKFDYIKNSNHKFFPLKEKDLIKAEERLGFKFPPELREFYLEVGYGFFKGNNENSISRLMDPDTIADITLREGIYEYDPDLEGIYEEADKIVFYEVNEGVYLTLDLNDTQRNSVHFFDNKIADSLESFIKKVDKDNEYFFDMME
ncbi:SMI1/KNR4 family protein [Peribacillus simplex]|uniref:SMI1/KNR4 family protein n=1 Tax=Peribacillus simplex NBRC 15720 = DSM 1321 TaxID=1349754 RepID=A0A223EQA4_9BACI|nr:SMI1/KNR4 family protein [Peribacillus simplex]ASS97454.1 SMI1/KNR4 family protein [Peribacillus simplex NBRC 15720 = DSM 1321]MEC1400043.1 SMI1/KNR4 family protein [Peribacillus simplex]